MSGELAVAVEVSGLRDKIEKFKARIRELRANGAAQVADYQADAVSWLLTSGVGGAARGLNWFAATVVELVSALGLLVVDQALVRGGGAVTASEKPKDPPWRLVGEADEIGAGDHG